MHRDELYLGQQWWNEAKLHQIENGWVFVRTGNKILEVGTVPFELMCAQIQGSELRCRKSVEPITQLFFTQYELHLQYKSTDTGLQAVSYVLSVPSRSTFSLVNWPPHDFVHINLQMSDIEFIKVKIAATEADLVDAKKAGDREMIHALGLTLANQTRLRESLLAAQGKFLL